MNLIWHSECARTILMLTLLFHCGSVKRDQCYPIKQTGKLRLGTLLFWNTKPGTGRECLSPGSRSSPNSATPACSVATNNKHTSKSFFAGLASYFLIFLPMGKFKQTQMVRDSWVRRSSDFGHNLEKLAQHHRKSSVTAGTNSGLPSLPAFTP